MADTVQKVINALDRFLNTIERNRFDYPKELKRSIINRIQETRSIDTGRFIQAVDFREFAASEGNYRFILDSAIRNPEVYYDGYVEVDGIKRNWKGRFNYRDGIKNANFQKVSDAHFSSSFAR